MPDVQAIAVNCNHCGAPLSVPQGTRFVTCTYCNSQLEVHRSGGAAYTQVLEQITRDVATIRHQSELDALDRQWVLRREQFPLQMRHGLGRHLIVPIFAGSLGVVCTIWGASKSVRGWGQLLAFGLVLIGAGLVVGVLGAVSDKRYQQAQNEYQARRQELLSNITRPDGQ